MRKRKSVCCACSKPKSFAVLRGDKDIKVDVRVSAATNERLEDVVKAGRFPEDLYYCLDVFGIHLPPLTADQSSLSPQIESLVSPTVIPKAF
jgi:transcriptional regulator with PAS, ATPase and Fis domain